MRRVRFFAALAALLFALSLGCLAGCAGGRTAADGSGVAAGNGAEDTEGDGSMEILLTVGGQTFRGTLENSAAGAAFADLLPVTLDMSELNGNEKYFYLNEPLPANAERVGHIETGDLMLFGSDCVVLFYESFSTSYSYTRLGRVENAAHLAAAVGGGSVSVLFSVIE